MENALYNNTIYYITVKKSYSHQTFSYEFMNNQTYSEFKNNLYHNIVRDFNMESFYIVDVDHNSIHSITNTHSEVAPPISYLNILRKIKIKLLNNDTKEFYFYVSPITNTDDCMNCIRGLPLINAYDCTRSMCQMCLIVGNNAGYRNCDYCNSPLNV
jgi:hypothetical protein